MGILPPGGVGLGEAEILNGDQLCARHLPVSCERVERKQQILRSAFAVSRVGVDRRDEDGVEFEAAGVLALRVGLDEEPSTVGMLGRLQFDYRPADGEDAGWQV